uniref:Hva1_TUDOR domain-containing protein n=1 Tax=Heterorhabditis bacteriophora TaxID=37862 RepID=A0A1I7XQS6_HETBA
MSTSNKEDLQSKQLMDIKESNERATLQHYHPGTRISTKHPERVEARLTPEAGLERGRTTGESHKQAYL